MEDQPLAPVGTTTHNIKQQACKNLYFAIVCLGSIDGNSGLRSWGRSAMNGPVVSLIRILFCGVFDALDWRNLIE